MDNGTLRTNLGLDPLNVFHSYSNFVHRNATIVKILEGCVGNAFYYMPSRFTSGSMEELSEIGTSLSSLLGVLHDTILATPTSVSSSASPSTTLDRLGEMASLASIVLTILDHGQVLLELSAIRRGPKARENLILQLETVKLMLRLIILSQRRSLLLNMGSYTAPISPNSPNGNNQQYEEGTENHFHFEIPSNHQHSRNLDHNYISSVYVGRRSGRCFNFSSSESNQNNESHQLANETEKTLSDKKPPWLLSSADLDIDSQTIPIPFEENKTISKSDILARSRMSWLVSSEILYFSRPLLQALLNRRLKNKWKALLISIVCEILSLFCWVKSEQIRVQLNIRLNYEEKAERKRRQMLYLFYLLRAPLWDKATLPFLQTMSQVFSGIPILSGVWDYVMAFFRHNQKRHFRSEPI